ncbi:unnamed protein product, partial [Allacma fusca]
MGAKASRASGISKPVLPKEPPKPPELHPRIHDKDRDRSGSHSSQRSENSAPTMDKNTKYGREQTDKNLLPKIPKTGELMGGAHQNPIRLPRIFVPVVRTERRTCQNHPTPNH